MSTAPTNPAPATAGAANPAPANPAYISLSELGSSKLTAKDLLPLVPATIISLVLNAALVFGLVAYDILTGKADAGMKTKKLVDDETKVDKQDKDEDPIDIEPTEISTLDITQNEISLPSENPAMDQPPGIETPPTPDAVKGIGSGDKGDIQGATGGGNDPLSGIFTENSKFGLKAGADGAGPLGEGSGLPGGLGTGDPRAGGFGARNGNLLEIARRSGGNDASQAAVAAGLEWLSRHQGPDGAWSLTDYHKHGRCQCKDLNFETGVQNNNTAATALALLPFLGAGHTHKATNSSRAALVYRGLNYLINKQDAKGDLGGGMYSHGLATITLCEAYAMSQDTKLRQAAQKAINFIVYAQNPQNGGWRYGARSADGDTSVVAWQVMGLRSGQIAGLVVPSTALEGAKRWLDKCSHDGQSKYSYTEDGGPTAAMTAAGLLNRQYLGWGQRNPDLHKGCKYLASPGNLPQAKGTPNEKLGPIYYYYYASQVLHHMDNEDWQTWNPLMREKLLRLQEKEGHKKGSWNPDGADHGNAGGRIYATSLSLLTLEVYYRYLPLYRKVNMEKAVAVEDDKGMKKPLEGPKKEPEKKEPEKKP